MRDAEKFSSSWQDYGAERFLFKMSNSIQMGRNHLVEREKKMVQNRKISNC